MSRGGIRNSTLRCPEVGLGIPNSILDASRLRRAEVGSRGDRQDERMSRRSSRYKGGVTRGREEQPQGNSTMKRGSPTTKMSALRVIRAQGKSRSRWLVKKVGR